MLQFKIDDISALETAIKEWFEQEHGLIDAWIFDTRTEDWQKVLDFVSSRIKELQYLVDGEPKEMPSVADDILKLRPERTTLLQIKIDGIALRSYFFCLEEIDFDIDPREVGRALALQHVFEFFRKIADPLKKDVVITPEGAREFVIFRLRPGTDVIDYRRGAEAN